MTYFGWIGLFLLGVSAAICVVALEVARPKAPLTIALRNWQTGLAGLIGFCGVWISLAMQPVEADRQHKHQMYREGLVIAMSMQVEAIDTKRWMKRADELILNAGKVMEKAGYKDQSPELYAECAMLFGLMRAHNHGRIGIIDLLRQELGSCRTPSVCTSSICLSSISGWSRRFPQRLRRIAGNGRNLATKL